MKKAGIFFVLLAYNVTSFAMWVSTGDWDQKMWTNQLLFCVGRGDIGGCKKALSQGAQINQKDDRGRTPLMWAIHHRRPGIVQLLLGNKASVEIRDDRGRTALHRASSAGRSDFVNLLMRYGSDPDHLDKKRESSLDKVVFCSKNRSMIDSLLTDHNVDKLSKSWYRIVRKTDDKMLRCLLSRGLLLPQSDLECLSPVHKQCIADRSRVITEMLDLNKWGHFPTVLVSVVKTYLAAPEQLRIIEDLEQQYPEFS